MSYYYDDVHGADGYGKGGDAYGDYGASADLYGGVREAKSAKAKAKSAKAKPASARKSKFYTPEEDRRRRLRHLKRRSERHVSCTKELKPEVEAAKSIKDEKHRKMALDDLAVPRRKCVRLSREQSKRRAFFEGRSGYERTGMIRTASGHVVYPSDLRKKRGIVRVHYERPTNLKFEAWKRAVKEVGYEKRNDGKNKFLLPKKNSTVEAEAELYTEIKAEYDRILDNEEADVKRSVEKHNDEAKLSNFKHFDKNKSDLSEYEEKAKKKAAEVKLAEKQARKAAREAAAAGRAAKQGERRSAKRSVSERKLRRSKSAKSKERIVKVTAVPVGRSTKADAKQARAAASHKQIKLMLTKPKSPNVALTRSARVLAEERARK